MTKVYKDAPLKALSCVLHPSLEEARQTIMGIVDSIGEYQTESDKSRAIALLITPMAVKLGHLAPEQCPPYKIRPQAAESIFADVLYAIYGEDAKLGCKLLA